MIFKNISLFSITFLCSFFSLLPANSQSKKEIVISGHVENRNPEIFEKYNWIWLYNGMGDQRKLVDSVKLDAQGNFKLKVKPKDEGIYSVDILKWQIASFWSDGDVSISARGYDTSKVKMRNSGFVEVKSHSDVTQLINLAAYYNYIANQEMELLNEEWIAASRHSKSDTIWKQYIKDEGLIRKIGDFQRLRLQKLIEANPDNPALVYLLNLYPSDNDSKFYETQLANVIAKYPKSLDAKYLKKTYETKKEIRHSLKKGSHIPSLAYPSPEGEIIDIDSFKGKYVLIDFWASWCGPCRKAIPAVKEIYDKYKDKGFEVLSVSVDSNEDAWRSAMAEENMPWSQVLSPDKEKTLKEFMVIGIPTLFLIDREGNIVEKFTGFSESLKEQIERAFESEK